MKSGTKNSPSMKKDLAHAWIHALAGWKDEAKVVHTCETWSLLLQGSKLSKDTAIICRAKNKQKDLNF